MAHHHRHHQLVEDKSARQIMASSSSSSSLFCYPDVSSGCNNPNIQTHLVSTHLQSFDPNPDIYSLATGIEMIGFQHQPKPTHTNPPVLWKGFSGKMTGSGDPGPSKDPDDFYRHGEDDGGGEEVGGGAYVEESSLRTTCVFPCEGNERPSQGLSLSLSSNNPSTIGLQSFELRHQPQNQNHHPQQQHEAFFLGKSVIASASPAAHTNGMNINMQFHMMKNSKYLRPTQELLDEFCSIGSANDNNKKSCDDPQAKRQLKKKEKEHWEFLDGGDDNGGGDNPNQNNGGGSSSSSSQSNLYGLNLLELQKRKTKLLGLLEELDRRYRLYCEQMKGVVASFEGVAGPGAANVYTALASKAMSRHFRSLRDAIVGQIKATKKAMGEKDAASAVPGSTRGETPRLRMLDQALRQQRAYQQMTMMETHPWRPQRGLPERSVSILRAWLFEHFLHPYPSDVDKHILARQTGLTRSQVSNWFINARVRLWKPMVEQMYLEETKEEQEKNIGPSSDATDHHHHHQSNEVGTLIQPSNDQKPTPDQLLRVEPESLSSIINGTTTAKSDRNNAQNQNPHDSSATNHLQQSQFGRVEGFDSIDLDFPSSSSFHPHHAPYGTQNDTHAHQGFGLGGGSGGGNVSLTLGLQQHGGNGVSLAFSPASDQSSLFYARGQIDDCQPVHQYSLLDGDQGQNLPYRNLMGAQLLHDFA